MTWKEQDEADRLRYEKRSVAGEPAAVSTAPESQGPQEPTLYDKLGVAPTATASELRKAWLQLLVTAHPDKGGCPSHFHSLQQAYALLSDPAQRVIYDEKLALATPSREGMASGAHGNDGGGRVVHSRLGVTVVVHGQSGPSVPLGASTAGSAAAAGAAVAGGGPGGEVAELNSRIAALELRQQSTRSSGGSGSEATAAGANGPQALAELFLQRARVQQRLGRLHHAHFDACEAARLCPDWQPGGQLIEELNAALRDAGGGRVKPTREAQQEGGRSRRSSDDES